MFEDILDGYFPLRESLRQMMARRHLDNALVSLLHAPAMRIPGLAYDDPVPLYLNDGQAMLIDAMLLLVQLSTNDCQLSGVARWRMLGETVAETAAFEPTDRLAEPAFVRGVELMSVQSRAGPDTIDPTVATVHAHWVWGCITRGEFALNGRCLIASSNHPSVTARPVRVRADLAHAGNTEQMFADLCAH